MLGLGDTLDSGGLSTPSAAHALAHLARPVDIAGCGNEPAHPTAVGRQTSAIHPAAAEVAAADGLAVAVGGAGLLRASSRGKASGA